MPSGAGRPVIVSDRVGSSELMTGEARELVFPSGDRDALADRLTRLAKDAPRRDRLGARLRETAGEYTTERTAERFGAALREFDLLS